MKQRTHRERWRTRLACLGFALGLGAAPLTNAAPPAACAGGPIKLIVPFPAGAAPDVVARLLGNALAQDWGNAVIVENRPGAGGIPGMAALVRAAPDGCTLGFLPAAVITLTPHLYRNPQFNVDRDLHQVALVGISPMMVAVNSSSKTMTLGELIKAAKDKPGKFNFAAAQSGSVPHLTGELLSQTFGLGLFTVPYSGSQAAVTAVLAGDADITVDGLPALVQHVKAGKLRALAVTSDKRLPGFESVPAVAEISPGFESIGWFAVYAPARASPAAMQQVGADIRRLVAQPELAARMAELGVYPRSGPSDLSDFAARQRAVFKKVVDTLGLQPQ